MEQNELVNSLRDTNARDKELIASLLARFEGNEGQRLRLTRTNVSQTSVFDTPPESSRAVRTTKQQREEHV
jgi:hypothetical protein